MPETNALIGYGITLSRGDGASPEVYTKVAELADLTPPAMSKDSVEATHTDSPDGFKEFIPGMKDGGEVSMVLNLVLGNATQRNTSGGVLHDFLNETTSRNWKIAYPGSPEETCIFKGFITAHGDVTPMQDKMQINVTFKVTGKPTFA